LKEGILPALRRAAQAGNFLSMHYLSGIDRIWKRTKPRRGMRKPPARKPDEPETHILFKKQPHELRLGWTQEVKFHALRAGNGISRSIRTKSIEYRGRDLRADMEKAAQFRQGDSTRLR